MNRIQAKCIKNLLLLAALALPAGIQQGRAQPAANAYADGQSLYEALRAAPDTRIEIGGGVIDVVFADGAPGLDRGPVLAWIRGSAEAVTTYFGRFPVGHLGLLVVATHDTRIGGGTTYGNGSAAIRIRVGDKADSEAFRQDWVMVHEMTHLALPSVPRRSTWLLEGNATYVEPIARAQSRQIDDQTVWKWTVENMPGGQPRAGDGGLDGTQSHSRIYWGGAAFWLIADVRIRQRTRGRIGVQAALRAINRQSGGTVADWSMDQVMQAGDAATGGTELADLYAQVGPQAGPTDIAALLAQLGVGAQDGRIVFDDTKPLAAIRRQITQPPRGP